MKIKELSSFSIKNPQKNNNEDSYLLPFYTASNEIIFAVADGVGSYDGAQYASKLAIESVREVYSSNVNADPDCNQSDVFNLASSKIIGLSTDNKKYSSAATTLTFVCVRSNEIAIGHIGDCRVYYKNNKNKLIQITQDHTKYQDLLLSGTYTKKELSEHKERLSSILTSAISNEIELNYNLSVIKYDELEMDNDLLYLYIMSDGAYKHWDHRAKFSEKTMNSVSAFASSLKRRIEKNAFDDYTLISLCIELPNAINSTEKHNAQL